MTDLCTNKKAYFNYEILDTLEAGIKLQGTEVKSLKEHGGNLSDAYVMIKENNEVVLKNASIAPYKMGNIHNHQEKQDRILLLHKKEIRILKAKVTEKGLALVPISLYFKNGFIKLKIGVAKGKKLHDKRASLKEKQDRSSMNEY